MNSSTRGNDRPTFVIGLFLILCMSWGFYTFGTLTTAPRLGQVGLFAPRQEKPISISRSSESELVLPILARGAKLIVSWKAGVPYVDGPSEVFTLVRNSLSPHLLAPKRRSISNGPDGFRLVDGAILRIGKVFLAAEISRSGLLLRYNQPSIVGPGLLFPGLAEYFAPKAFRTWNLNNKPLRFGDGTVRWDKVSLAEKTVHWPKKHSQRAMVVEPLSAGHYQVSVEDNRRESVDQVLSANTDFLVAGGVFRIERVQTRPWRLAVVLFLIFALFWGIYIFWAKGRLQIAGGFPLLDVAFLMIAALNFVGLALMFRLSVDGAFLGNFSYFQNKLLALFVGFGCFFLVLGWPHVREMLFVVGVLFAGYAATNMIDANFQSPGPLVTFLLCSGVGIICISRMELASVPGEKLWERLKKRASVPATIFFILGLLGLLVSPLGLVRGYKISEFSKIFFILYFSLFFSTLYLYFKDTYPQPVRSGPKISLWRQWIGFTLPMLILIVIPLVLTFVFYFLANDFGPFLIFALVFAVFICFAMPKFNLRWARGLVVYNLPVLLIVGAAVAGLFFHREILYWARDLFAELGSMKVTQRIDSFFQPWRYSAGEHIAEILWYGTGSQQIARYVPNMHSDMIFAEMLRAGIPAVVCYLTLNVLFVAILFHYGRQMFLRYQGQREPGVAPAFVAILAIHYWVAQHFVNIGATLGFSLMTGLTLPFLSYGGTSTLSWLILLAVVYRQWRYLPPNYAEATAPVRQPLMLPAPGTEIN